MIAGGGIYSYFFLPPRRSVRETRRRRLGAGYLNSSIVSSFSCFLRIDGSPVIGAAPFQGVCYSICLPFYSGHFIRSLRHYLRFSVVVGLLEFRKRAPVIKHALISNQWISLFDVQSLASHRSRPALRLGALLWCAAILGLFPTCTRRSSGQRLLRFVLPLSSLINWIDFRQQLICLMIHS